MALSRGGKGGKTGAEIQRLSLCLKASLGSGRLKKLRERMDVTGKGTVTSSVLKCSDLHSDADRPLWC